jgi:L-amino acid N-acyltransferase YncA
MHGLLHLIIEKIGLKMIRKISLEDVKQICSIYNYHVTNTIVTFEEEEVIEDEMKQRIQNITSKFPWLVYEQGHSIAGYAYASQWRTRSAYRYAAETTIYINEDFRGKGIGTALYTRLIGYMKERSFHSLIGGISLPNNASIALHEKLNFKKVAHFEQVGFKLNRWIDVGYWELLLNS